MRCRIFPVETTMDNEEPTSSAEEPSEPSATADAESCDYCGSADLWWRNCKLLCRACHQIVKSCADL